jgi:hypothetical protein
MTKLVIGLAVVVVVVLIIVILAARNMRTEDRDDFGERSDRSQPRRRRDGSGWRDYDRRERSVRQPVRDGRSGARQSGQPRPPAGRRPAAGRVGFRPDDQRIPDARNSRSRGHDDDAATGRRAAAAAPARSRQSRGKRSDDSADWPSTEWDKLSDVDYWAELASDKPLTTTAQPAAPARPAPAVLDRDALAGAGHGAAGGRAPRPDAGPGLPVRNRPQFAAAPVPLDAVLPGSTAPGASVPGGTVPHGAYQGQRHVQMDPDDDPLTSPSFPRVPADDSRSYRSSRGGPSGATQQPAPGVPTEQFASYGRPTAQFGGQVGPGAERAHPPAYPDAVPGPGSYPGASAAGAAPLPSGNPYGSYVSSPPSGGFPAQPARDLNGYASGPYPPVQDLTGQDSGWYPRHGSSALPAAGDRGSTAGQAGFDPLTPGRLNGDGYYPPGQHGSGYPAGPHAQGGYLPAGYPRVPSAGQLQDPYGQDGYSGSSGYDAIGH